jgi:hypothetical protein
VKGDFDGAIARVCEAQRLRPGTVWFDRMIERFEAARAAAEN